MTLVKSYERGMIVGLSRFKVSVALGGLHPTAKTSPLLGGAASEATKAMETSMKPGLTESAIDSLQQGAVAQPRKLAEELCTTCRRSKHYGACSRPVKTPPPGKKMAGFNQGMYGDGRDSLSSKGDSHLSPYYHSATVADSALSRARSTLPPGIQASSAFSQLANADDKYLANQSDQNTGGLAKVSGINALPGMLRAVSAKPMTLLDHMASGLSEDQAWKAMSEQLMARRMPNGRMAMPSPAPRMNPHGAEAYGKTVAPGSVSNIHGGPVHNTNPNLGAVHPNMFPGLSQAQIAQIMQAHGQKIGASLMDSFGRAGVIVDGAGPTTRNPYAERSQRKSPPLGAGPQTPMSAWRAFDSTGNTDSVNIENDMSGAMDGPYPFA